MTRVHLDRIALRLTHRVAELEARLEKGEEAVWPDYLRAVEVLALLLPNLAPERHGALLTTKEMAERLGVSPKTLLKHKANGRIRPHLQQGKLIRWRSDRVVR